MYKVYLSSSHLPSFFLFLTHSMSYLEQNVVSRKKERKTNKDLKI